MTEEEVKNMIAEKQGKGNEFDAMKTCFEILNKLSQEEKKRVLKYLADRFNLDTHVTIREIHTMPVTIPAPTNPWRPFEPWEPLKPWVTYCTANNLETAGKIESKQ